jgi:hypothetical protein
MYRVWIDSEGTGDTGLSLADLAESPVLTIATDAKDQHREGLVPWSWTTEPEGRERIRRTADHLWPLAASVVEGLLRHALRDAGGSDFLLGDTPETWSPAGSVNPSSLGQWISNAQFDSIAAQESLSDEEIPQFGGFTDRPLSSKSPCLLVQSRDDVPISVVAVGNDAFLVVVPPGSHVIRIRVEEQSITTEDGAYPDCPPWEEMAEGIPKADARELLIWRFYQGQNSQIIDGCSEAENGIHRLVADGARTAGVLIGRLVRVVTRRASSERSDPLLAIRRRAAWRGLPSLARDYILASSPPLGPRARVSGGLVVVVHGSQSTGLHLAVSIRDLWQEDAAPPVPVLRFEHDTWQRLEANASDLASRIHETRASHVILVAHSRGGLVAARAMRILKDESHTTKAPAAALITLGSPFLGTPMAHAADAVWASVHALMGAVRLAGGPALDATTRVLSWTIKRTPPEGIRLMYPSSDVLPSLRATLPAGALLVGGHTNDGSRDFAGLRVSLRAGLGEGAFDGEYNDLVVATASALAARRAGLVVCADHSSYMLAPEVRELIKVEIGKLPSGRLIELAQSERPSAPERLIW